MVATVEGSPYTMHPQGMRGEAGERGRTDPHGAARSSDLSDDDLDADIARLVAIRRARQTIGFGYSPRRPAATPPARKTKVRREHGCYHYTARLAQEAELLERILSDALARLDRRDRQNAKAERRRQRRRQLAWIAGTWTGIN